jgi:hypothetical protein
MAQKITVTLEDDLDGGPADETVRFGVDGKAYEIDLSATNATALRRQFAPFIDHARKAGPGRRRRTGNGAWPVRNRPRSDEVRAWAKQAGIAVNERGRIPASVIARYEADGTRS